MFTCILSIHVGLLICVCGNGVLIVHGPVAAIGVDVLKLKKWWIWKEGKE